ncbi:hypothetical protein SAMN04489859_108911 [Paracoccus alcaliphilus]|uniref:Uncharacterized protein n=1 Tax=Paracoccus alcaliphilus TaxID=34002 RepID=A0A1H8PDA5_9RHOB|nr:hypothetical protein SAMN04489859_108911 [Paracoccus alcaliphilus]
MADDPNLWRSIAGARNSARLTVLMVPRAGLRSETSNRLI